MPSMPHIIHLDNLDSLLANCIDGSDSLHYRLPEKITTGFDNLRKLVAEEFQRLQQKHYEFGASNSGRMSQKNSNCAQGQRKPHWGSSESEGFTGGRELDVGRVNSMMTTGSMVVTQCSNQMRLSVDSTQSLNTQRDETTGLPLPKEGKDDESDGASHLAATETQALCNIEEEFQCWDIWIATTSQTPSHADSKGTDVLPNSFTWKVELDADGPAGNRVDKVCKPMILSPTMNFCIAWDLLFMLVIMWDCITIPLQFLDPPAEEQWIRDVSIACLVFWTLTIPRSLMTGFVSADGRVEMRPTKVFKRYVYTWCLFDLLIVSLDWADNASRGDDLLGSFRIMKSQRALKLLKAVRLARILKLPFVFNTLLPSMYSQKLRLLLNVLKISACVLLVAHIIACLWYAVGKKEHDGQGWIEKWNLIGTDFNTRYTYSLHFALTQFTGSPVVDPTTNNERWFAIAVLLFAYVSSAGFVSAITASLTRLSIISSRQATQFAELRRYLRQHEISAKLAYRVTQAAHYAVAQQLRYMSEQEVSLLGVVTKPLRAEIHYEVRSPILTTHSFFHFHDRVNQVSMLKICHVACRDLPLAHHDLLFSEGERSANPQMYFIINGKVKYLKRAMESPLKRDRGWFCEACLWCHWIHLGGCRAGEHTSLLSMDVYKFHASITKYVGTLTYGSHYAISFVEHLNKQDRFTLDDLDCGHFDSCRFMSRYNFQHSKTTSTSFYSGRRKFSLSSSGYVERTLT